MTQAKYMALADVQEIWTNKQKPYIGQIFASKQNVLTFDSTPVQNSANPVTSGGLYTAIQNAAVAVTYAGDFQGIIGSTTYNEY